MPSRLCPHIKDRDIERKEFRDQFNRELSERKTFDEQFLSHLGERKTTARKATAPKTPPACTQQEEEKVQQVGVEEEEEVQDDKVRERLAADILDREIRQQKIMAEVEEVRIRQDQLYEKLERELEKAEKETPEGKGDE